jgi:hypothetical protein
MKKGSVLRIAIAVVVYLLLYIIGASSGMIHPRATPTPAHSCPC